MKIAIYVSSWPAGLEASGIVTYTDQLVTSLRALGHEVYVVTPIAEENDEYTININDFQENWIARRLRRLMSRFASVPAASAEHSAKIARAVRMLVKKKGVEIFEIEEAFGWSSQIAQQNIVPVVVRLHGPFFLTGRYSDAHTYLPVQQHRTEQEGQGIAAAHYITVSSALVLDDVREHYGLELKNSAIIPLPIEPAPDDQVWSTETSDRNKILFVGRFDNRKGGDFILEVFAKLAATNPDLTLTFVGPDPGVQTKDGPIHFQDFIEQNYDEELRSRIDYRGHMKHADVMALRQSHYLTVIATQYETLGYMLLEAMSLGCPIVTTDAVPIPEVIRDEDNGLLVPSQDLETMVAACQRLLDDPELASNLGNQARMDCQKFYSSGTVTTQTLEAYSKAIEKFKAGQNK